LDLPERVEVANAGLRVLRRDRTAADGVAQLDDRLAHADAAPDPAVLLVRLRPADPDQHPEAPCIDRLLTPRAPAQLLERRVREHRHAAASPVDSCAGSIGLDEAQ